MNSRKPLSLLLFFTLIFNQVAASIHLVEHIAPEMTPSLSSAHTKAHNHLSEMDLFAHHHADKPASTFAAEHDDNTTSCLFLHVILATTGPLSATGEAVAFAKLPVQHAPSPNVTPVISTTSKPSIRGPPGIT